jgi:hypothetical protein
MALLVQASRAFCTRLLLMIGVRVPGTVRRRTATGLRRQRGREGPAGGAKPRGGRVPRAPALPRPRPALLRVVLVAAPVALAAAALLGALLQRVAVRCARAARDGARGSFATPTPAAARQQPGGLGRRLSCAARVRRLPRASGRRARPPTAVPLHAAVLGLRVALVVVVLVGHLGGVAVELGARAAGRRGRGAGEARPQARGLRHPLPRSPGSRRGRSGGVACALATPLLSAGARERDARRRVVCASGRAVAAKGGEPLRPLGRQLAAHKSRQEHSRPENRSPVPE